jgi:hypothetical protein
MRIYLPEGNGPHTKSVFPETISSILKGGGQLASAAELLAGFIEADGIPDNIVVGDETYSKARDGSEKLDGDVYETSYVDYEVA